jgi:phosphatidylserine decarboxylase
MSVLASIRNQLAPVHREGLPFIGMFALASLFCCGWGRHSGWLGIMATLWHLFLPRP